MPYLSLKTSASLTDAKAKELLLKLSAALSSSSGKEEKYCMISIDRAALSLGGKDGAGAFVDIRGIGGLTVTANKKISAAICAVLKNELAISPEWVYLNFTEIAPENWGHNSSTFG